MLSNKYSTVYFKIVERARARGLNRKNLDYYTEKHHIIPRSLRGTDDVDNLVLLTAKEHYVCHHLLTKMTEGFDKELMKHAFAFMCNASNRLQQRQSAAQYGVKRQMAAVRSPEWIEKIRQKSLGRKATPEQRRANSERLTGRKLSQSHRENIRKAAKIRGFSDAARQGKIATLVKEYIVIHPSGVNERVINLKQWCIDRGFNYGSAANNCKHPNPIRSGPLTGYKFTRCI